MLALIRYGSANTNHLSLLVDSVQEQPDYVLALSAWLSLFLLSVRWQTTLIVFTSDWRRRQESKQVSYFKNVTYIWKILCFVQCYTCVWIITVWLTSSSDKIPNYFCILRALYFSVVIFRIKHVSCTKSYDVPHLGLSSLFCPPLKLECLGFNYNQFDLFI